jgi:hypothetical protein
MAYNLVYRMDFKDIHRFTQATWRIDFLQKDGLQTAEPVILKYGSREPLVFTRSQTSNDKYTTVIGSKATISYYYDGTPSCPKPEVFINIEEDTWMIIIYKNGVLNWKGFLKPDNASYPWLYPPYEFSVDATDYISFMKGKQINLDDNALFLYDWVTIGDFFNRTVFHTVGYDDAAVKLLMNIKPKVLGAAENVVNALYVHTDAFYDFEKGPLFVYDCLQKFAASIGARFFYSAGAYWIQRIADLDQSVYNLIVVTPGNLDGAGAQDTNVNRVLGSTSTPADLYYLDRSQLLRIIPAIKQQTVKYKLQAYNRLQNFQWAIYDGTRFPGWNGPNPGSGLILQQLGVGTVADPFRNRMSGNDDTSVGAFIWQSFIVIPGQFISLQMKARCNYTKGVNMRVALLPTGGGQGYYMDSSGDWKQSTVIVDPNDPAQEILVTVDKATRLGTLQINSKQIPNSGGSNYTLILNIFGPTPADDPNDPVPPGESLYNELYPAFLRIYNNSYERIDEKITNSKAYSLVPEDADRFFLDMVDNGLSNCLFYSNGGTMTALPKDNWDNLKVASIPDRGIDEYLLHNLLDQSYEPSYVFEGDVYSNNLEFHNTVVLKDLNYKRCMLLKDTYRVRSCRHTIQAAEIKTENSGNGTYEVLPISRDR